MASRISGSTPVDTPRRAPAAPPSTPKQPPPPQTGFSGASSFESGGAPQLTGWKAADPYMKKGYEQLKAIDSDDARRALAILAKGGYATKAELAELGSASEGTGLLGQLKDQLPEGTTSDGKTYKGESLDEAVTLLNFVKGMIDWMASTMFVGK